MPGSKPICTNDFLLTLSQDEFEDVGNLSQLKTTLDDEFLFRQ